jgi:two-component system LytT family response regulator
VLIVDDEKPARMRLVSLLEPRKDVEVVGVATDGRQAVDLIRARRPQIVFLDIQMPLVDGFGVLRAMPEGFRPAIVFVTAYDRYAIAAFEAHAVDYLLKPFSDDRFESALSHALDSVRGGTDQDRGLQIESLIEEQSAINAHSGHLDRLVIRQAGRLSLVAADDIDWISSAGVYVEIHAGGAMHLYRSSLNTLLQRLNPTRFVRVHRSTAVNTERIVQFRAKGHGDYTLVLRGGKEITMSRAFRSEVERWLGQPL